MRYLTDTCFDNIKTILNRWEFKWDWSEEKKKTKPIVFSFTSSHTICNTMHVYHAYSIHTADTSNTLNLWNQQL